MVDLPLSLAKSQDEWSCWSAVVIVQCLRQLVTMTSKVIVASVSSSRQN